jgi:hypothetical protein
MSAPREDRRASLAGRPAGEGAAAADVGAGVRQLKRSGPAELASVAAAFGAPKGRRGSERRRRHYSAPPSPIMPPRTPTLQVPQGAESVDREPRASGERPSATAVIHDYRAALTV